MSRMPAIPAAWMASAQAMVRALTSGSIRSSNSTISAESPARTMRQAVDIAHAGGSAATPGVAERVQTAFDAEECPQAVSDALDADADFGGDGNRRERVSDVVGADERQLEGAERRAAASHAEPRRGAGRLEIVSLPIAVVAGAE